MSAVIASAFARCFPRCFPEPRLADEYAKTGFFRESIFIDAIDKVKVHLAAATRRAFRRERDYYCARNDNAVSQSRLLIT